MMIQMTICLSEKINNFDLMGIYFLGIILLALASIIIWKRVTLKKSMSSLGDDEAPMDEPVLIDYNGKDVFIPEEDMAVWNDLPRKVKRETIRKQEKMVSRGELVPIELPNGEKRLITREEAIEKGVVK